MGEARSVGAGATYAIAGLAFALSYSQLADLAARAGYGDRMARVWPLAVDGLAVVATAAVMRLRDGRGYAWFLLIAATAVSAASGAVAHLVPAGPLPPVVAAAVAVVPPLCLPLALHLAVLLRRDAAAVVGTREAVDAAREGAVVGASDVDAASADAVESVAVAAAAEAATVVDAVRVTRADVAECEATQRVVTQSDAAVAEPADARAGGGDASECLDAKWRRARHLLVTRPDMSQRAVAREVRMDETRLRRFLPPGGRKALVADATEGVSAAESTLATAGASG
ncbi:DUF2637 domain-containing protein [Rhodococcus hoagii]|nr:DUF2637 domain-containing protein [Prescottella equi]